MLSASQIAGFFKIYYLKKEARDQVNFSPVNEHQSFLQVYDIILCGRGETK